MSDMELRQRVLDGDEQALNELMARLAQERQRADDLQKQADDLQKQADELESGVIANEALRQDRRRAQG